MDKEKQINKIIERTIKYAIKNIDVDFAAKYAQQIQKDARRYIISSNHTISSKELSNYIILAKRISEDILSY